MKFKIGDKVKILDYRCYIADKTSSIPRKLMIHGNCMPRINHNATIVDIYNQYYIVNFINQIDEVMQLGYTEDNLELVSDEFVLPEKWCIKPTETSAEVIFAYFSSINHLYKGYDTSWIISPSSYFVFPQKSIGCWGYSEKPDDYTEITFDQFKKYVLKDTVETIEKPKFEVGKWYKWFQNNHNNCHIGKIKSITARTFDVEPWIMHCKNYLSSGTFLLKEANNITSLTDLSEIQQYLPDGHVDKVKVIPEYVRCTLPFSDQTKGNIYKVYPDGSVEDNKGSKSILTWNGGGFEKSTKEAYDAQFKPMEKNEFKKGDYIVIVSGRENLDFIVNNYCYKQYENHNYLIAEIDNKGLGKTRASGVDFDNTNDRWRYATPEEIAEYDRLGEPYDVTTLKNETLVFGKYPIGTIVVSLGNIDRLRNKGDLFKILPDSTESCLYYSNTNSSSPSQWRAATESEIEAFNNGITNINNMNKSLVGRYLKALVDSPQSTGLRKDDYAKILDFYYEDKRPNKYRIEGGWCYTTDSSNPNKFELMPEGFVPPTKSKAVSEDKPEKWKPKVGDWVMISEKELPITSSWLSEGGRVKHQGPFLVEKIEHGCVKKMSGIRVLLAFGRFRKAEPHEIPKTEEPISGPITKIDGGQAKLAIYDETPLFQLKTSYNILQPKISQDYSKPETLLTKTTLNY